MSNFHLKTVFNIPLFPDMSLKLVNDLFAPPNFTLFSIVYETVNT